MKKIIKKLPPKAVTAMLAASGLLLLSGSIGGTRAALTYISDEYQSKMDTLTIGVALEEANQVKATTAEDEGENSGETKEWLTISHKTYTSNGSATKGNIKEDDEYPVKVEVKNDGMLLTGMLAEGESLKIGKEYTEELRVRNTGKIGEYVRVTIYKYWTDTEMTRDEAKEYGKDDKLLKDNILSKDAFEKKHEQSLEPDVIDLELDLTAYDEGGYWIEDEAARTKERTVLYYSSPLSAAGKEGDVTRAFTKSLTIDQKIVKKVTETESENEKGLTLIKSTYDYDGKQFIIEVEVDAVQDHNAEDAILSAWGRNVTINGDHQISSLNGMESVAGEIIQGGSQGPQTE